MRKLILAVALVILGAFTISLAQPLFAADANDNSTETTTVTETEPENNSTEEKSSNSDIFAGYWKYKGWFDYLILALGGMMFAWQIFFLGNFLTKQYWATQNEDNILELNLGLCEAFPVLGLLGTVLGLLNTFSVITFNPTTDMSSVIADLLPSFAPALTTTVSGMIAMLFNLLLCVFSQAYIRYIAKEDK